MKKKLIIIIAIILVLLIGGGLALYFLVFKDGEKEAKPEKVLQYELDKTMTYLASEKDNKSKKQTYVSYTPVIFYTNEETLALLEENKTLLVGEIEKYFNTKTLSKIQKMRGKNVEDDKDRIELDLEERVSELMGEKGENITRISLLGFVIN